MDVKWNYIVRQPLVYTIYSGTAEGRRRKDGAALYGGNESSGGVGVVLLRLRLLQ